MDPRFECFQQLFWKHIASHHLYWIFTKATTKNFVQFFICEIPMTQCGRLILTIVAALVLLQHLNWAGLEKLCQVWDLGIEKPNIKVCTTALHVWAPWFWKSDIVKCRIQSGPCGCSSCTPIISTTQLSKSSGWKAPSERVHLWAKWPKHRTKNPPLPQVKGCSADLHVWAPWAWTEKIRQRRRPVAFSPRARNQLVESYTPK